MIFSAGEYDAGASLLLNSTSTTSATMHMEGADPRREKRQPSHFGFKSQI
jgi:hypothetical protein